MKKRFFSLLMTLCLLAGMIVPGSFAQAASESVEYNINTGRDLWGSNLDSIEASSSKGTFIDWSYEQYDDGKLNWYILAQNNTRSDGKTKLNKSYGIRVGGNVDSWIAIGFEAPGSGTYTMQMTYSESAYGAELALAYIIPMSDSVTKASIESTIDNNGALGCVDFYSATASGYDNKTATLGSYSFTAGEEYVMILYASEGCDITGTAAYMLFSKFTAVKGTASSSMETEINPVDLGPMITEFGVRSQMAVCEVNGYDYYFLPIKGGQMHIYNLDYYCDGDSSTEPYLGSVSTGITNAWGCSAGEDGKIYVSGDAKYVYRYDPVTKKGDKLTFATSYVCGYDVGADVSGNVYVAVNTAGAGPACYNNAAGTFQYYYGLDPNGIADECSAVAWDADYIYAYVSGNDGISVSKLILKIDKASGELVKYKDVSSKTTGHLTALNIVDGVLFGGSNNTESMIAINTETWDYVNVGVSAGVKQNVSEELNGKVYFLASDSNLYQYTIATKKASKVGLTSSQQFVTCVNSIVTLDVNGDGKDENVILSSRTAKNGYPLLYDPAAKKLYSWTDMINENSGAYVGSRDVYSSNDGSNMIYMGAYVSNNCAAYNTKTEDYTNYITAGQTDSQIMYKGVLYAGNYSSCTLARIDVANGSFDALMTLSGYKQKRIHCLAAGEDKIFFSTVPDTYDLGGYLAWYDLKTGAEYYEKVSDLDASLADQVVISMAYSGGYLYCGTTVRGGSDATVRRTTSHFFIFDVANKKVVAIQEIAYPYIASLDADSSGTVWGVISKTLFTVSYKNGAITFTQKFSNESGKLLEDSERKAEGVSVDAWFCKTIYFGKDGNLYVGLGDTGLWKITKSGTGTRISTKITGRMYALSEDGNIYYGSGTNLILLPLNVSSSDKAAANAVNTKLENILKSAPANTQSAVAAAEEAFQKLTNVQKGMVDQAMLNAAKRRLTVKLIEALPSTVTTSNMSKVEAVQAYFDALPSSQQIRVKNADVLEAAMQQVYVLKGQDASQQAVIRVIERIKVLPSVSVMTLSDKSSVSAARKAYDALSSSQKSQVTNYSTLVAAEKRIAELEKSADQEAALAVIRTIATLPSALTKTDREKVENARAAYDALTEAQKAYVTNYGDLIAAEITMQQLTGSSAGSADVDAVSALIASLPQTVTAEHTNLVTAARAAYDALTKEKQVNVANYQKLLDAEAQLAALDTPGDNEGGDGTQPSTPAETPGTPGTPGSSGGKHNNGGFPGWMIALIVVGGVLIVAGVGVCVVVVIIEKKKETAKSSENVPEEKPTEE